MTFTDRQHFSHSKRCARLILLLIGLSTTTWLSAASEIIPRTPLVVQVPARWQVDKANNGALFTLRSPLSTDLTGDAAERARGVIALVTQDLTTANQSEGPLAFAVRCRRDIERTAMGLVLEPARERKLAGHTWTEQPYRMQVGQFIFRQVMLTSVINAQGICLTMSCEETHFAKHTAAFDAVIASLSRSSLRISDE
jgi:hypothetical protein